MDKQTVDSNSSTFDKVRAGGDIAGRDINKIFPSRPHQLDLLNDHYKIECKDNSLTNEIIDELHHYRSTKSEIRDLSQKLSEAGFEYLIENAEELKELVSKLIVKYQYYKSAQKIITYVLSDIESIFNSEIKPRLATAQSEVEVTKIFRESLVLEIQAILGENVLEIYNRQINGMVYFLTGNCHLEWQ